MADLKIAIIGAGPSGCMLARLLDLAGISSTIFEAEKALDFRSQGGTLDLHTDSGLKAIRRAGLYDQFLKHARFDGEAMTIANKNLVKYIKLGGAKEGTSRGRPEIDRPRLREILMQSVPQECVQWGKRLVNVSSDLKLNFQDGSESGFDLIVGADGAFSRVRPLLSAVKPHYSGVGGYQGLVENPKEHEPELYELVNRGSMFAMSDRKSLMAQQMGDGSILTSTWTVTEEQRTRTIDPSVAETAKENIKADYRDWHPTLLNIIDKNDNSSLVYRPLYMLPIGHSWEHRAGVTLIGDAAHLMTPFAGEGVNLAFSDAMALADAITKTNEEVKNGQGQDVIDVELILSQNIKAFEQDMFQRATKVQKMTYDMMHAQFFLEASPRVAARTFVLTALSDSVPWFLYPIIAIPFYIYFFIHGLIY